jgi:hypothetical protein
MSPRNISPSPERSRSALDHRGVDVAARLLVAGIWLERQFAHVPKILSTWAAESGTSGPAAKVSRILLAPVNFSERSDEEPGNRAGH